MHVNGFGASSIDVMVYFFFKCDTWSVELREKHNVFIQIMRLAKDLRVEFAYPTQSLLLEAVANPTDRERPPRPDRKELTEIVTSYGPSGGAGEPKGFKITDTAYVPTQADTDEAT